MSAAVSEVSAKRHLPVLTISEVRSFKTCALKHHYRYRLLRRAITEAYALTFGTLWHLGLEVWWKAGGDPAFRLTAALTVVREQPNVDPFDLVRIEELLLGYTARWGEDPQEQYETIDAEVEFRAPIINPRTKAASRTFQQGGKLDVLARRKDDGRVVIVEHKTTSEDVSLGADYWRLVSAVDPQVSTYMQGARALGYEPDHCVYDVVRKPTIRPLEATPLDKRKYLVKTGELYANQRAEDETPEEFRLRLREKIAEAPDRYFARGHVVRLEADEARHAWGMWQTTQIMREAQNEELYPPNGDACMAFHRPCEYLGVCGGEISIDDDNHFRTASGAHEELNQELST